MGRLIFCLCHILGIRHNLLDERILAQCSRVCHFTVYDTGLRQTVPQIVRVDVIQIVM